MEHLNDPMQESELDIKRKLIEIAVKNGDLDHLDTGMPAIFRLKKQLHRLAESALQHDAKYDTELQMFQSVIGMVNTLISECRVHELYELLIDNYPEYYLEDSEQGQRA